MKKIPPSRIQLYWKIAFILTIVILIALTIWAIPFFISLKNEAARDAFIKQIADMGFLGAGLLVFLQALQVVIAIIPAGVVQVIAGAVYGVWGGLFITMAGVTLGSATVFIMVRKFGGVFATRMVSAEKLKKFSFLQEEHKRDTIVFLLFFIPGSPKDVITYFMPMTSIKLSRFLLLSSVARIPSALTGVLIGITMGQGMWLRSIAIFLICALVGLVGLIYKDRLINRIRSNRK